MKVALISKSGLLEFKNSKKEMVGSVNFCLENP
jgi:hypothetical protein